MTKRPIPKRMKVFSDTSKEVFSGVRFKVFQWEQQVFDGSVMTYEVAKRNDAVTVLAVREGNIVLVKEQQPHWHTEIITTPGGLVDEGEDIFQAAQREMKEETGYTFKDWYLIDAALVAPGVEWVRYFFVAKHMLSQTEKNLDSGEMNSVFEVTISEFIQLIRNDELHYNIPCIEKMLLKYGDEKVVDLFNNPENYIFEE